MSTRIATIGLAIVRGFLLLFIPTISVAGTEPTQLTVLADDPDPSHAHYGYVVSFALAPTEVIPDPAPEMTGTITATDGQSACTATLPDLSCVLIPTAPGNLLIEASYSGDGFYAADDADAAPHEVLPFALPEIVSRGDGIGPGLFPNQARDITISADGQHVAMGVATPSIYYESGESPTWGVFVYDIPERSWDLVSVNSDGTPGTDVSDGNQPSAYAPSISSDGRWVAFETYRSDLGGADPNDIYNVYLFDRDSRTLYWVSEDMIGGHGSGRAPSVSDDGTLVAFESRSPNLVPGDTNVRSDIFVWNRISDTVQRISVDANGNEGTDNSEAASISGNGQYVAFQSSAPNLVVNDNNNKSDVFVYDLINETIDRISLDINNLEVGFDSEAPSISQNGDYVAFSGLHLTPGTFGYRQIYVRDRILDSTLIASQTDADEAVLAHNARARISADGRYVTFQTDGNLLVPGDTDNSLDVFLRDLQLQTTTRVSVTEGGGPPNGPSQRSAISNDGQRIVYLTSAQNLVDVPVVSPRLYPVVFDRETGTRSDLRITASPGGNLGNGDSNSVAFSGDGRYVAFSSLADNLVPGDTNGKADIFVRDRQDQSIERVSLGDGGVQGDADSLNAGISMDGRFIVFSSASSTFYGGGSSQVLLYDRQSAELTLVSRNTAGTAAEDDSVLPAISADGNFVSFYSRATDLVQIDSNGDIPDLFVYNRQSDTLTRVISAGDLGVDGTNGANAPAISEDGRYTAFITGNYEVWMWDRVAGTLIPTLDGDSSPFKSQSGRLGLSANGQLLSLNINLGPPDFVPQLLLYDFQSDEWNVLNSGTGYRDSTISANGRFVVAQRQVAGGFDIHLFDTSSDLSLRISQQASGTRGNGANRRPAISADGHFIGFHSDAPNLVSNDTNGRQDVFVFENPLIGLLLLDGFEDSP